MVGVRLGLAVGVRVKTTGQQRLMNLFVRMFPNCSRVLCVEVTGYHSMLVTWFFASFTSVVHLRPVFH